MPALAAVLDAIACAILGDANDDAARVGAITLHAHQREALEQLRTSMRRSGGALLADEPGLGKTYVALALAKDYGAVTVVAPAALRTMWHDATLRAHVDAEFISFEALSQREVPRTTGSPGHRSALVIVDEAHHVCNPATARYDRLARLAAYRSVLLLTATPVRNRDAELGALLALFMGPRAYMLEPSDRSRCIVRRSASAAALPAIDGPHWHRTPAVRGVARSIAKLPPPLPVADGREASALVALSLARCWASSVAALDAALRRRLQRSAAFEALLAEGLLPTRSEMRAWVVGEDSVQLAFPMLAAHAATDAARFRTILAKHVGAVRALRDGIASHVEADAGARAHALVGFRAAHAGARLIAFTAYAATAEAIYRALRRERGVALLTSRGARTASGARPRSDVIRALGVTGDAAAAGAPHAAAPHGHDDISLVVTTDLLSEGVNLQGASIIVHLDVPWTPAGLEQRVGRAVRMGSPHACVQVHGFAPPPAAERLLVLERRHSRKHAAHLHAAYGPDAAERLRTIIRPWRLPADLSRARERPQIARAAMMWAPCAAFIAVIAAPHEAVGELRVVWGRWRSGSGWKVGDSQRELCALVSAAVGADRALPGDSDGLVQFEQSARAALERWLARRDAARASGTSTFASRARRVLLARLDTSIANSPSHARAELASRVQQLRATIAAAAGAGMEQLFDELARSAPGDLLPWLTECETRIGTRRIPRGADGERSEQKNQERGGVRALLLLHPGRSATSQRSRLSAPRAASP